MKKPIVPPPAPSKAPAANRLVLDPILVMLPPSMAAKLSGIITIAALLPSFSASAARIGMKITTTGVLFMIAEISITTMRQATITRRGVLFPILTRKRAGALRAPVCTSPWPTTRRAMIVISAGSAKPISSDLLEIIRLPASS